VDKDQLIKEVFKGVYQRLDGPIIYQNWAYNNQLKIYNYSPTEATAVIAKKPLTLTLTVIDAEKNTIVAQMIKSFWEQAGVKVNLKIVSKEEAPNIIRRHDFEALIYGEAIGGDPDVYAFWHSSQIGSNGLNLTGYSNLEVDKLLVDGRSSADPAKRLADYQQFQAIITTDLPVIWLYSPTYTYVQAKRAKGFNGSAVIRSADRFASVASWYLNTHKKIAW
jgi:peptide/nickel transport system substrate-binding protein